MLCKISIIYFLHTADKIFLIFNDSVIILVP